MNIKLNSTSLSIHLSFITTMIVFLIFAIVLLIIGGIFAKLISIVIVAGIVFAYRSAVYSVTFVEDSLIVSNFFIKRVVFYSQLKKVEKVRQGIAPIYGLAIYYQDPKDNKTVCITTDGDSIASEKVFVFLKEKIKTPII